MEERRNGKCRQGRASEGGCGGAVAVVPAGMKRKSSSRNGCEPGPSSTAAGIIFKQGSIEWYEGEERARGRGRGGQFWEREEKDSQRRGCCQRSTCDYSRVDYLC